LIGCCVVMGLQVYCKDIRNRALNGVLFHHHPIHVALLLIKL
jgi:hypothetical protein